MPGWCLPFSGTGYAEHLQHLRVSDRQCRFPFDRESLSTIPRCLRLISKNSTIQLAIAKAANAILCAPGSVTDGVVVTHGTGTSFPLPLWGIADLQILSRRPPSSVRIMSCHLTSRDSADISVDLTVNCGKPVVIVGAMRPATAYSADGPANLLQAVTAAASPLSKDRGALITMNDRVGSAWYTQKTHGEP